MSLLDSAKYQLKTMTNAIKTAVNATVNSTTISYGFIGISTAILGYYTFFENDIETPATEQPAMEQPAMEQPATEQPATEQPATEQPAPSAPFSFGASSTAEAPPAPSAPFSFGTGTEEPPKKNSFFGGKRKKIYLA